MSVRTEGRALGDGQLRSGGGEVGDDGGGLRGADDGGAGGGGAAWRDERALGHLATGRVLGVGHHDARVVHVLVVTTPVMHNNKTSKQNMMRNVTTVRAAV